MEINIKRHELWTESMFEIHLPDIDNESIIKFYDEIEKVDPGQKRSNIGGWQREVNPGECQAYDELMYMMAYAVTDIFRNVFKLPIDLAIANSWLNSNILGENNAFHTHPGCVYSGVYYINASKDKENGSITFVNPQHHVIEDWISNLPLRSNGDIDHKQCEVLHEDKQFASTQHFEPKSNYAYVFPPWTGHEVRKNPHSFNRLVAGINFRPANQPLPELKDRV